MFGKAFFLWKMDGLLSYYNSFYAQHSPLYLCVHIVMPSIARFTILLQLILCSTYAALCVHLAVPGKPGVLFYLIVTMLWWFISFNATFVNFHFANNGNWMMCLLLPQKTQSEVMSLKNLLLSQWREWHKPSTQLPKVWKNILWLHVWKNTGHFLWHKIFNMELIKRKNLKNFYKVVLNKNQEKSI